MPGKKGSILVQVRIKCIYLLFYFMEFINNIYSNTAWTDVEILWFERVNQTSQTVFDPYQAQLIEPRDLNIEL